MDLEPCHQYFPDAIQIADLFHAREHLWDLARKLHSSQQVELRKCMMVHQDILDGCQIEQIVAAIQSIDSSNSDPAGWYSRNSRAAD
jgi:hypothetical protein